MHAKAKEKCSDTSAAAALEEDASVVTYVCTVCTSTPDAVPVSHSRLSTLHEHRGGGEGSHLPSHARTSKQKLTEGGAGKVGEMGVED